MIINDNIAALNAWRNLTATDNRMQSVLEHLSSGLRINKAADDAAGLAISQKMLAQINGLDQAARNAQDGISLVQTAEGAMGQAQDILQRMRQLAVQASSDTETVSDRYQLQIEMDQLAKQLTDIANHTEFNTKRVLTGEFASGQTAISIQVGANAGQDLSFYIAAVDAATLGVGRAVGTSATVSGTGPTTGTGDVVLSLSADNVLVADGTTTYTVQVTDNGDGTGTLKLVDAGGKQIGDSVAIADITKAGSYEIGGTGVTVDLSGVQGGGASTNGDLTGGYAEDFTVDNSGAGYTANVAGSAANGWTASVGGGLLITSRDEASAALAKIDEAINQVSASRATLGATQNRLQYVINDLQITSQNLSDAKSRITDTDMAKEMAEFTKEQILQQAGVAMLAQANAMPQAVLKLLG
ncbi:MAG: flagellin [Clostridia bacterium]|nr:flagellin [Clostridia bacterium]